MKKTVDGGTFVHVDGGRIIRQRPWICAVAGLLVAALILSGCAPGLKDARRKPGDKSLARIENVGLCVTMRRGFAVRLGYQTNTDDLVSLESSAVVGLIAITVGSLGAGVVAELLAGGALVVAGTTPIGGVMGEPKRDKRATLELTPEVEQINSPDAIALALVDKLHSASVLPAIQLVRSESLIPAREHGMDALLSCTVRRWGLRHPLSTKRKRGDAAMAQLELDMNLRLVSVATGKVLWKRDQFYLDKESYSLVDFKSKTGLLAGRMEHALQSVCDVTTIELRRIRCNQGVTQ